MIVLYGYSNCTFKKYYELLGDKQILVLHADQKYHSLLIRGLSLNGVDIKCVSGLPINRTVTKKIFINEKDESEDNVFYHYIDSINLPIFRQICIYFGSRRFVKKYYNKDKDFFVICDCLNIANSYGMLKEAKKQRIPIVFIVTDIPEFQRGGRFRTLNNRLINQADGFIFLTEQMNEKMNPLNRPYTVLEGHADDSLLEIDDGEHYEPKLGKKVIMYAGSIKKRFGIQNLVEGFIKAQIYDSELRIYGDGDYRDELVCITKRYQSVRYMGIKSNQEIVREEQKASLLVNPRPIAPEYTKYSFPSKNMEYMVSGTPMLTTKLPGMPAEYYPYVYLIEDESPDGIADALNKIFAEPFEQRQAKAKRARAFVLENKSNIVQAAKIIKFLEKEL